jgi:cathepsin L
MFARDPKVTTFTVSKNNSNTKMKEFIAKGPVAALINGDFGFQAYKSGVYSGCPSSFSKSLSSLNHAVVIIGYDVDGNYIVKNSWGTSWGMNGFGVVSKDRDCALSAYAFQFTSSA